MSFNLTKSLLRPFNRFLNTQNLSGKLLLLATAAALIMANTPLKDLYEGFWATPLAFTFGEYTISNTLHHWINDGLMVIFFFVIGLEIKREILVGELSDWRKASLPLLAAFGGMIVPATIYLLINAGGSGQHGWGIPMATDIAFALGCLMVLGKRIPVSLKVFLLALAIVDDIGAILVIALAYTSDIILFPLILAGVIFTVLILLNYLGVRNTAPYAILGIFLWLAMLQSGIHATLAGVLLAFTIPARAIFQPQEFIAETNKALEDFPEENFDLMCTNEDQRQAVKNIEEAVNNIDSPLQRLEDALHPVSAGFIVPLFALANAGISLDGGGFTSVMSSPVMLGIILGLVLGKQIGIMLFSYLGVRLKIAYLPKGTSWVGIYGVSCLAGIGFTMSLFITTLAFSSPQLIHEAKIGILCASILAAILGLTILHLAFPSNDDALTDSDYDR